MSNLKIRFGFEFDDGKRIISPFDQDSPITISPAAEPLVCRYKMWDLVGLGYDVSGGEQTAPAPITVYLEDFGPDTGGKLVYAVIRSDIEGYLSWGEATDTMNSSHKILSGVPFTLSSGQHTDGTTTASQRSMSTERDILAIYFYPGVKTVTAPVLLEAWLFGLDT